MATGGGGGGKGGVGRDEEDVDRISSKEEEKDLNGEEPPAPSAKSHQPKTKKSKGKGGQQGGGILRIDTSGDGSPLKTGGLKSRRKSSSGSADYRNNLNADENRSPLPSVDRLSVSFVMGESVSAGTSSVRADSPVDVIPPAAASGRQQQHPHYLDIADEVEYDDDEYSVSAQSILQQRRRSGGKSGGGRRRTSFHHRGGRRASSPFPGDEFAGLGRDRRRTSRGGYSVATISSGEMNIPMDDGGGMDEAPSSSHQQQLALHKEVVQNMRYQPWDLGRKLRILRRAKQFIREHEGALQLRLAESRDARDVFARAQLFLSKSVEVVTRETKNVISFLVPWEARIKEIESLFGSAVASYFTFLRWVFWINLVLTTCFTAFVVIPEVLATEWDVSGERKGLLPQEKKTATDLQTLWDFEGILKYSPIFYGFYSNAYQTAAGYKLPFAYFFTGLVLYMYSFVAILRKMAKNSRNAKLSDKEDECTFTWKLFTGWDFMIGHQETAENRISAITLGFKEALLEEKEKERETEKLSRNVILARIAANFLVLVLLCSSAYIVVLVVERSAEPEADDNWWRQNEITVILSLISIIFPNLFELIGIMEKYHPRRQLRWQLARIMILNLLNLYTLILALFGKVNTMTNRLAVMKANISMQGLNVADLVDSGTMSTTFIPPTFNDSWTEGFNVTETSLFILNATESLVDMEAYSTSTTTTPQPSTTTEANCFQVMVDCSTLKSSSYKKIQDEEEEEDYVYEEEDAPLRAKRQIDPGVVGSSANRTAPKSLTRLLDSLNTILRGLQRNVTRTPPSWNASTTSTTISSTTTSTTEKPTTLAEISSTNESIDELFTAAQSSVQVQESSTETTDQSSPYSDPDFVTTSELLGTTEAEEDEEEITSTAMPTSTTTVALCPIIVCPWNDTVGYFTPTPKPGFDDDDFSNSTLPCRGDNPTGCTPYWTSTRDSAQTVSSLHSSTFSTEPIEITTTTTTPKPTLDPTTRLELRKLCWETMFGQELVKLTIMDLVFTTASILIIDFLRALFVRTFNGCWCWDLEKYFPQYGEFKIAENILHLVNNQGMVWMGMFFSPGLTAINIVKLFLLLYIRSWAVLTCNVPHEVIFRASRSNNFYLWLLLIMLFLCTLPVAYAIVWLEPSWHCGPFSDYARIFHVLTRSLVKATPESLHWVLSYIASPGVVIPLLVLLILVIYYLVSLSSSLREAVTDLRTQLRRERDAERFKTRQKKEELAKQQEQEQQQQQQQSAPEHHHRGSGQWRNKAVPFGPPQPKAQQIISQALAKEAVEKRFTQSGRGHHRAGSVLPPLPASSPPHERESSRRPPPLTSGSRQPAPRAREAPAEIFDGSDLDISDSLPNDNCSPVLIGDHPPSIPPHPNKDQQPVYAVVKKKKDPSKAKEETVKPRIAPKPARLQQGIMTDPPRSPINIPLIRISQTESVEKAEKNPPPSPPVVVKEESGSGLVAVSPTKSGALNLILQRSKERRGVVTTSGNKSMKVSDSTSDLVDNMEETAADTPVYQRQLEPVESVSSEAEATITDNP